MHGTDSPANSASFGPATVDVQDPLPETNWFWRRIFTFALALMSAAFIWYGLESLNAMREPKLVYGVTRYMIGVHVMLITYYMLAPSAEQLVKLVQAAKLMQSGVPITRRATVETPEGGRTEVETTAGVEPESDVAPRSQT